VMPREIDFNYENLKNDNGKCGEGMWTPKIALNATELILARNKRSYAYKLITRLLSWLWPHKPTLISLSRYRGPPTLMSGALIALTLKRKN
jgi:hypothetical protein